MISHMFYHNNVGRNSKKKKHLYTDYIYSNPRTDRNVICRSKWDFTNFYRLTTPSGNFTWLLKITMFTYGKSSNQMAMASIAM